MRGKIDEILDQQEQLKADEGLCPFILTDLFGPGGKRASYFSMRSRHASAFLTSSSPKAGLLQQPAPRAFGTDPHDWLEVPVGDHRLGSETQPEVVLLLENTDAVAGDFESQQLARCGEIDDVRLAPQTRRDARAQLQLRPEPAAQDADVGIAVAAGVVARDGAEQTTRRTSGMSTNPAVARRSSSLPLASTPLEYSSAAQRRARATKATCRPMPANPATPTTTPTPANAQATKSRRRRWVSAEMPKSAMATDAAASARSNWSSRASRRS